MSLPDEKGAFDPGQCLRVGARAQHVASTSSTSRLLTATTFEQQPLRANSNDLKPQITERLSECQQQSSDGPIEVAFSKKQRIENTLCDEASLTDDQLQAMTNEELIKTVKSLQAAVQESHKQALSATTANKANQPAVEWTPEKVAERAVKARELVSKEIKKQMKWQPSCKRGCTKWSYKGMVPNVDVFNKIFEIEQGKKPFKLKKLSMSESHNLFGYISASCRYNDLNITEEHVNLKWDPEESTFQLSGTYGI